MDFLLTSLQVENQTNLNTTVVFDEFQLRGRGTIVQVVPEPTTGLLLVAGLLGLAKGRRHEQG